MNSYRRVIRPGPLEIRTAKNAKGAKLLEHARLAALGVVFRTLPISMGPVAIAAFEDTCGNVVQLVQVHSS